MELLQLASQAYAGRIDSDALLSRLRGVRATTDAEAELRKFLSQFAAESGARLRDAPYAVSQNRRLLQLISAVRATAPAAPTLREQAFAKREWTPVYI